MKAEEIRNEFALFTNRRGRAVTLGEFARHLIKKGAYTAEEIEEHAAKGMAAGLRAVLKVKSEFGVPFAQPIYDEAGETPAWQQLQIFNEEQMAALIQHRIKEWKDDAAAIRALWQFSKNKFGRAPELPPAVQIALFTEAPVPA